MDHLDLVHQAKVAIDKVAKDPSEDFDTVLGSLEELRDEVEEHMDMLRG